MTGDALLVAASLAGPAGVSVLRLAWGRSTRAHGLNLAGWSLILAAAVLGWTAAGAWGTSVAALFAMLAAFVLLGVAGWRSTPGKLRASNRRVGALPERGEPLRLGRRALTFTLVAVVAAILAAAAGVAMSGLALLAGAGKADAYVLALTFMPIGWGLLAFALLMQPTSRRQMRVLAVASVPLWPVLAMGALS